MIVSSVDGAITVPDFIDRKRAMSVPGKYYAFISITWNAPSAVVSRTVKVAESFAISYVGSDCSSIDLVAGTRYGEFHASILRATLRRIVGSHRIGFAVAVSRDQIRLDALRDH